MKARVLATLAVALIATSAMAQTSPKRPQARITQPPVWQSLERFSSDAEFLRYVRDAQQLGYRGRYDNFAVADSVVAPPPPPPPPPPAAAPPPIAGLTSAGAAPPAESVVVTGASSQPADAESSITNVQTQGVDEGGIVKQIGRYLVVLQDGRVFVVDTRANGGQGLALASRTNVYRSQNQDTWYDEMLTSGNRVLVTGYSYAESASEVTVFTLGDNGQLTREATYYISSNDYYDVENYATRLVNGNLVIYTPLDVMSIDARRTPQWPLIRRWIRDGNERRAVTTRGRPLFDAMDIYKPVQSTRAPVIHSVSVCPLGGDLSGDELECRTTAFVAAQDREFYVSTSDIYLWVTRGWADSEACTDATNATIFQVPLNGAAPRAVHANGEPITQLALDSSPTEFRALVNADSGTCRHGTPDHLNYVRIPFSSFSTTPRAAPSAAYTETPYPGSDQYEIRFTPTHVVYGARNSYGSSPPQENAQPLTARVVAVPLERPRNATTITAPHNIIRVERAGRDVILTGYRTEAGLSVSLLDLAPRTPRIAQTRLLENRYESEGRSHAFNALVREEGDGIMGLPTVSRVKQGARWHWRSEASDITYLTVNAQNELADAGQFRADPNARDPNYQCEVSCVDWYGNTRALFIGDRVFGLSATELIEGSLQNGRVVERQRLNLSRPIDRSANGR